MRQVLMLVLAALFIGAAVSGAAAGQSVPEYLRVELAAMENIPEGTWFALSKEHFKLFVISGGKVIETFGIAAGKNKGQKQKVGDCRTPEGMFSIIQIQNSSYWTHDFRDGAGEVRDAYGPWFLRLETGWKGIGIHGTHAPASIGTRATEGCIRLVNDDLRVLKEKYVRIGTKVYIFN